MNIARKTSKNNTQESGVIPALPDNMSERLENVNWWYEVRSVLGRQNDEVMLSIPADNVSFSTSSSSPYEYVYTHGTGKYPLVQVLDNSGQLVNASITHNSVHSFTVSHTSALTGTLIIR